MKTNFNILKTSPLLKTMIVLAAVLMLSLQGLAQTAADTQIKNTASATYSDGTNNYNTVSNEVTVTVAKVAGLVITPDAQTNSNVVPGQQNVSFTFRVTNVGNFTDQVRFLANGASVRVVGAATVASANIVGTPNVNILTNGSDVLQSLAQNGFVDVEVKININAAAAAGSSIQVFLGDATTGTNFDNVASNSSANEVRTVSTGAVNGSREARGDISVTVDNDAQPRVNLTVPAGPVALGSDLTYSMNVCNDGQRVLSPVTGDTQIYVVAPIPAGTVLKAGQTYAAGTQFTTSPLSTAPTAATWVNTAPSPLSSVTRIRIPVGASIAAGTCTANVSFDVTITTTNANTPIYEIVDVFGNNTIGTLLTDQSGDSVASKGDGNANFNEPLQGGTVSTTQGFQQPTLLTKAGNVLIGPNGAANAVGPTNNNDDYTNKSVNTGIAGVAFGGNTTAAGTVVFTNTIQNTGNADDTFTLTAPTVPAGFTVEISTNGGTSYTTVSSGGSTTIAIPFGQSKNILVRVTAPSGQAVLTGYNTVIRATSGISTSNSNDTIDRLYTGFIRLNKSVTVANGTGVGGATDAVPGAVITYSIAYSNIAGTGGTGNITLNASNFVITEDGNAGNNNWGTFTTQVVGAGGASDTNGGTITGNTTTTSTVLTDTVGTLNAGASGTFTFKRVIK
ncbi:MAG: beta strand repeat-containing protein [Aridibacter sp.]